VNGTGDKNCLLGRTIRASPLKKDTFQNRDIRTLSIRIPSILQPTDWIDFHTSHFADTTTKLPLGGASPSLWRPNLIISRRLAAALIPRTRCM
jgi:hypothetical protein